ncbi:NUDIX domain-containing protein [Sulfitobacter pontiacus]|jgi:nudix-type nucleoside diphosphatase (YffH/AdpP family)|uniref:NUDIX domain-containing protein n=1 Tax=Sulfitobacter pontiacus TaxID=60137 RepID=UPI000E7F7494|nr:NUDIX domain-containing protein [Sulfitobacter pontiacus]HBU55220.1 tellurium resistance protein [Sulfitobacter sp.]HCI98923.1 tellurium resistance protein [Sulfitobacter sp.]|tara:strand:+ start:4277 stop:5410 length:1134 start_codon:yes stop_codon:yes gene_type:complete
MTDLFLYGSLRHVPLLEIVMGRAADRLDISPDRLPDHIALSVVEGPFPCIVPAPGQSAEGLLLRGLGQNDLDRLNFYEGSFAYDLQEITLESGASALGYFARPDQWTTRDPWSLAQWQADWGALSCFAAREVMDYFGVYTADRVAQMFPMIRSRAAAQVNALRSKHGAGTLDGKVRIDRIDRAYTNYFALNEYHLAHERFDGTMTDVLERAVFVATDAALVLPYDPVRDRVMLVEQLRMGPVARGDRAQWQLEPIAGRVDPGESPEDAAHREAQEEAGLTLRKLEKIAEVYASPGDSTEFFYIYLGLADLPDDSTGVNGLEAENEDIRSHLIGFDALMTMVDQLEAANAPLVIAAYWLARHRERLRLEAPAATPEVT